MASSLRVCCNALLAAYARAQPTQWPKAIRLLDLMWGCGGELCPDIVSYNTVIKACGNANKVDLGFKVAREGRFARNDLRHVPTTWCRLPTFHT